MRNLTVALYFCDERVFLALELLNPAEAVGRLYVE